MIDFETTRLWKISLQEHPEEDESHAIARARLRQAFLTLRERAGQLAGEIPQTLRDFTVHDITHLDALWETADLIAGPDIKLNALEGFVLGGAFLLHDLGMALAAFPGGLDVVKLESIWKDSIVALLSEKLSRPPTHSEVKNADHEIQHGATTQTLRLLHAKQAEKLALIGFTYEGKTSHLIEDVEIRNSLGPLIGRIAHSHWWPVARLATEFSTAVGAAYWCPLEWTIDPLKLGSLLRLADAAQLDGRRAPGFLRAIRNPKANASSHWDFQHNLQKPQRENDRLIFTSGPAFDAEHALSWWLCLEFLQTLDRELRQVDSLLADFSKERFAARSVAGAEHPSRLAKYVRTEGWIPVEAKIGVTNVQGLVKKLGGEDLYGRNFGVPLRELVQNSCDAVRARRYLEKREDNWGAVTVGLESGALGMWLEVEDNGIGMSIEVLTGPFLDFGSSYWGSNLMLTEFPGLLASGFQSTGKYGIGFFSTFMLGDEVQIITRRYDEGLRDTKVLEFKSGLKDRPLLRQATERERLREAGTKVRVKLAQPVDRPGGLLWNSSLHFAIPLDRFVTWMCPALDVDLFVRQRGGPTRVEQANDWRTMPAVDLLRRLSFFGKKDAEEVERFVATVSPNLQDIKDDDGVLIGRVAVFSSSSFRTTHDSLAEFGGVVTVGGLRSSSLVDLAGILVGYSTRASRESALPVADARSMALWATKQAGLLKTTCRHEREQVHCASIIRFCGGNTGELAIIYSDKGWLTTRSLKDYVKRRNKLTIAFDYWLERRFGEIEEMKLKPGVLVRSNSSAGVIYDGALAQALLLVRFSSWPLRQYFSEKFKLAIPWDYEIGSLGGLLLEILSETWNCKIEDILAVSSLKIREQVRVVGNLDGKPISSNVEILSKPKSKIPSKAMRAKR